MKYLLALIMTLTINLSFADEFDDLAKSQKKEQSKNPFNNREAKCSSLINGTKMTEHWQFIGKSSYFLTMGSIAKVSGTYKVKGNNLNINQELAYYGGKKNTSKRKFVLRFKMKNKKSWQYIRELKKRVLYNCEWLKK